MPAKPSKPVKRQSRLQFSPLPSSSPAKEKYPEAIQDRLVKIRYENAGQPKNVRSVEDGSRPMGLPTPENSSQAAVLFEDEPQSSPLGDPPSSPNPPLAPDIPRNAAKLENTPKADSIPPVVTSSGQRATRSEPSNDRNLDNSVANEISASAEAAEDEDDDLPLPSAKRQRTQTESKMTSRRTAKVTPRRSTRLQSAQRPGSSKTKSTTSRWPFNAVGTTGSASSDLGSAETTGDEDNVIMTNPTSRRQLWKPPRDDFVVSDNYQEFSSEEEVAKPSKSSSRAWKKRKDDFVADDDSIEYITSDGEPVTPSKRRKTSQSQVTPQKELRRRAELEEDLEDLADSDTVVQKNRTRGAPVNKAREETRRHLEILKRRRAGEKVPRVVETEDEDEQDRFGAAPNSHSQPRYSLSSNGSSADSSDDSDPPPENPSVEENEDDFIVDDSAEQMGIPHPDIPLQFTSYASRKPRELFIHVIDWLVKNKISPAFNRHDPLWELAFKKLDDEVKAQAGSRLISAAWNAAFVHTLLARPGLVVVRLPGDEEDYIRTCDACNRTNHPAQYDFKFSGKAYFHKTLEPVDNSDESDEDNDDNNDAASLDSKARVLPSCHQTFYLGRYCAANAEMGHKLSHWLFHLNQNLLTYLEKQGVLSPEKILARDKKNHAKREREAEMIVDTMRERGVVDDMWQEFKSDLDDARIGMDGFEKKGGRGQARIGSVRVQREEDDEL